MPSELQVITSRLRLMAGWQAYVRGRRLVHPPSMSEPVLSADGRSYEITIDTEPCPIANSLPGWDGDGRETWEFPT